MNLLLPVTALLMGLTGSLHCAGMCGPIIWVMPFQQLHGWRKAVGLFLYHFGRISIYALLGWLLFTFKSAFHPGWQQWISLTLGALFLGFGLLYFIPAARMRVMLPWTGFVQRQLAQHLSYPYPERLFLLGALHGMLPCGLVYMALATVSSAQSAIEAISLMYAFGAGTVPMLLLVSFFRSTVTPITTLILRKWTPVLILAFGCMFLLRGANLGIPYLSPKAIQKAETGVTISCHAPN